jgi:hypothetical protein
MYIFVRVDRVDRDHFKRNYRGKCLIKIKIVSVCFTIVLYIFHSSPPCHMEERNIDRSISRYLHFALNNSIHTDTYFLHKNRSF